METPNEMNELPASPRPMRAAYAAELHARLEQAERARTRPTLFSQRWPLAVAGALVVAMALVLSPTARAAAESFLSLFRVQRITAIAVDPLRVAELRERGLTDANIESLLGDAMQENAQAVQQAAEPRQVASPADAAAATGLSLRLPTEVLNDPSSATVLVQDAQTVHFKGDVARINGFLQALGVQDAVLPPQLDGAVVTVTKPAAVSVKFYVGNTEMKLLQSQSPVVELPDGVDLPQLGEVGLRLIGIAPDEAQRIAQSTDWNSTLLVPIPTDAASFRNVTLDNGVTALLVTTGGTGATSMRGDDGERQHSRLIWAEGRMVYALTGGFNADVVDVANTMR